MGWEMSRIDGYSEESLWVDKTVGEETGEAAAWKILAGTVPETGDGLGRWVVQTTLEEIAGLEGLHSLAAV